MTKNKICKLDGGWEKHWGSPKAFNRLVGLNTAYPEVIEFLLKITNKQSNCIEIGCGSGTYAVELVARGRDFLATDISRSALELTEARAERLYNLKIKTKIVNTYKIPFPDETFDLVFSDGVIEHLDIPRALTEMKRVLRPNGFLVAKVPSGSFIYKIVYFLLSPIENRPYEVWYSRNKWREIMADKGYKNVNVIGCGDIVTGIRNRLSFGKTIFSFLPKIGRIYYLVSARK